MVDAVDTFRGLWPCLNALVVIVWWGGAHHVSLGGGRLIQVMDE
jgi:hypothetical protein